MLDCHVQWTIYIKGHLLVCQHKHLHHEMPAPDTYFIEYFCYALCIHVL